MPKATQSAAGRIVNYFRGTKLEDASLVFDIVKDVMRERRQKSTDAKARAVTPPTTANSAADKPKKVKAKGKKKAKKAPAPAPVSEPLPLETAGDAGEAGDAPPA